MRHAAAGAVAGWTRGVAIASLLAVVAVAGEASVRGQVPEIRDARMRTVDAGDDLGATLAGLVAELPGPAWIAYQVAAVPGRGRVCCWGESDVCSLERDDGSVTTDEATEPPADGRLRVLLRVLDGRIDRLRMFTCRCVLDAGGLPVAWVRGVAVGASLSVLRDLIDGRGPLGERIGDLEVSRTAVSVLALHDDPGATPLLAAWARDGAGDVREAAIFWLGAGRGREGVAPLTRLLQSHPDPEVRERATLGLYATGSPAAIDALIQAARDDGSGGVRGRALFWLAQRAGERAAATLEGAVREDPDLEVREQAVFGLSQLPPDRGIPLLIEIARTHPQPEIRKRALFWLGQSGDERALDFIEELLRG